MDEITPATAAMSIDTIAEYLGWTRAPLGLPHKPKITGYRQLSEAEIALINRVKAKAAEVGELLDNLREEPEMTLDLRWLAIGRTHLQEGFMAIIRAIARPETF